MYKVQGCEAQSNFSKNSVSGGGNIAAPLCGGIAIMNNQNIFRTTRTQIGNTMYTVKTMPSERATETAEQKLVRLVRERISAEIKNAESPVFTEKMTCY